MKEFIKKFNNHNAYTAFTQTADFVKPNVSLCVQENEVHYNPIPYDYSKDYLTFVAKEDGTFKLSTNTVSYSTDDGETWTELAANTVSPTITAGNKIMWKGTITPSSSNGVGTFSATGNFDVQGNVMSLLYGDNYKDQTDLAGKTYAFYQLFYNNRKVVNAENLSLPATTLASYCYKNMFQSCTRLTTAPVLPATTLVNYCYQNMFSGCTSLVTAPELPATTLKDYCYSNMFRVCTSLVTAPKLPATTLATYCYYYMFYGCTSLTTAPELPATILTYSCYDSMFQGCTSFITAPQLPATTLATHCYSNMFKDCTNLTTVPQLPVTTLKDYCYSGMFYGCTSLTTAPVLPATTLASYCYQEMFRSCTNLTIAPELPATTLVSSCYNSMFRDCSRLNHIKAMFTATPSSSYTSNWVIGVASSGTFVKNSTAQWNVTGTYAIPNGWTVETASA